MSDTSNFGFGKFVPGFDFLQSLAKGASSSIPQLPNLSNWVAPTISVEELEKRIDELKAVQFWLEQNSRALTATVQALEVQKMTLATLKGMNFSMGDVASAFKLKPADGVMGSMQKAAETFAGRAAATAAATPAPAAAAPAPAEPVKPAQAAPADDSKGSQAPEPSVVDPMHWWGALTSQFQQIAAHALRDAGTHQAAFDATREMASGALKTASSMAAQMAAQGMHGMRAAAQAAGAAPAATPAPAAGKPSTKAAARPATQPGGKANDKANDKARPAAKRTAAASAGAKRAPAPSPTQKAAASRTRRPAG